VVHLSATTVPERMRLSYGPPTKDQKWLVYKATLKKNERRVVVADRSYSQSCLIPKSAAPLRSRVFESIDKLIEVERERTGLPVAVIGISAVVNLYLEHRLGKQARNFHMPFKSSERVQKMTDLKAITTPMGFMVGYAYAVAGSNDFCVTENGVKRFVRSLIVAGNIVPPLENVARDHRGLFAGVRSEPIDWTPMFRVVPFDGMERDEQALVAKNVPGFRDDVANAILHGIYEGELMQIVGRMRGQLPDPIDPTIVPTVYMFASVAIPGFPVDEVIGLEDLRERVGLDVQQAAPRGRPTKKSAEEQIRDRWKKIGPVGTMRWLVKGLFPRYGEMAVTHARLLIQDAGLEPGGRAITAGVALAEQLKSKPQKSLK
jgi:hypothetical protein